MGGEGEHLETRAVPQLVFRAALGHLLSPTGAPAVPQVLAHPRLPGVLAVAVPGDTAVRFYDCSPPPTSSSASPAGHLAPLDCSLGAIPLPQPLPPAATITRLAFSRDGAYLAVATTALTMTVFALEIPLAAAAEGAGASDARAPAAPAARASRISGYACASFTAETPPTALALLHFPKQPSAAAFCRFRHNHMALLSGHVNGFLNVWWCGNTPAAAAAAAAAAAPSPLASYPPFHASRGPITHISVPFFVDESVPSTPGPSPPPLFATLLSAAGAAAEGGAAAQTALAALQHQPPCSTPTLRATQVVVGAHGARGWRCYAFPHLPVLQAPPPLSASKGATAAAASSTTPAAAALFLRPDVTLLAPTAAAAQGTAEGHWSWDAGTGRRVFCLSPPVAVGHLTRPPFACPSYAECLRAPVVGWEGGGRGDAGWASLHPQGGVGGSFSSTGRGGAADPLEGGVEPRGCALLQRLPGSEELLEWEALEAEAVRGGGGLTASYARAARLQASALSPSFPGLPPAHFSPQRDIFAQCARGSGFHTPPTAPTLAPSTAAPPRFLLLPRTVLFLLTERHILAAGFDHAPGLASEGSCAAVKKMLEDSLEARAAYQRQLVFQQQQQQQQEEQQQQQQQQREASMQRSQAAAVKRPQVSRTPPPPPKPNPTAEAAKRLFARMHYIPPPPPVAAQRAPPPKPSFPMPATGRGEVVLGGRRQLFQLPQPSPPHQAARSGAARGGAGSSSSSSSSSSSPTLHQWLSLSTQQARTEAQLRASAELQAVAARENAKLAYMPRHSRAREREWGRHLAPQQPQQLSGEDAGYGQAAALLARLAMDPSAYCPEWEVVEGEAGAVGQSEEHREEDREEDRSVSFLERVVEVLHRPGAYVEEQEEEEET